MCSSIRAYGYRIVVTRWACTVLHEDVPVTVRSYVAGLSLSLVLLLLLGYAKGT
jgi:hypothetical protein